MGWNYRVMEFESGTLFEYRTIVEVYYDDEGEPNGYINTPAQITWEPDESIDTPYIILSRMGEALRKPVLYPKDFHSLPESGDTAELEGEDKDNSID